MERGDAVFAVPIRPENRDRYPPGAVHTYNPTDSVASLRGGAVDARDEAQRAVRYFYLEYRVPDLRGWKVEPRFPSCVEATSETVDEIIAARGLSESMGCMPSSRPPREKSLADLILSHGATTQVMHYACYIGFLAIKSGGVTVEEVLGDCGLVHEIAHHLDFGEGSPGLTTREELAGMAYKIEQAIPGYPYRSVRFRP